MRLRSSFRSVNLLWAGTDDGLLWTTHDHGAHWKNVTPPAVTAWSKVTQISASHFDDTTAYVSVSRMRVDDQHPYLFRTHDGGATWQSIAAGLPENSPVNTVREDPVRKGLLFAGTETGVWFSIDDGNHWQPLQLNLPHTSMRDLSINGNDLIVATHGRSFWILDDISPLRQLGGFHADAVTLFKPGPAYRMRRSTNTDTPLPIDEPQGENPPDGAVIDYSLPASATGTVTLEILDASGKLVRKYASTDAPYATPDELAKQLIPLYWLQMPQTLPADAGMHRWVWDMRATPPTATRYEYPISAVPHRTPRTPQGPLVLPGTYTVRLTAGGTVLTAPLVIRMDPRVKASPADLIAMHTAESKLARLSSDTAEAALQAHSLREQLAKRSREAPDGLKQSLATSDKQLEALLEGRPKSAESKEVPGLDDISSENAALYTQVGQVDAAPTAAQQQAAAHAGEETGEALRTWNEWKQNSLAKLNSQLTAAHASPLNLEQRPETMPEGGDED